MGNEKKHLIRLLELLEKVEAHANAMDFEHETGSVVADRLECESGQLSDYLDELFTDLQQEAALRIREIN